MTLWRAAVSFIIYLTDPDDEWTEEDGGALELFPLEGDKLGEPCVGPTMVSREHEVLANTHTQALTLGCPYSPTRNPLAPTNPRRKSHLPKPNSMAFFTVLPGRSFHAVEEVYKEGMMRLSISGWYHGAEPPVGSDMASLSQLQTRAGVSAAPI
jgi:hypothetical protein